MKQLIQDLKSGETILEEVPAPLVKSGHVLIKTSHSLVSLGTEKMLVEFGKANLLAKARSQPDKVKMVLDKMKTDGIMPTLESVFNKLNEPLPLGYCNVGEVIEVGHGVSEFKIGDRVASNGPHAEIVQVPKNLVASIPPNVSDEEASFTVIGSIGLQGIRLVNPTLGETIVVIGLGLIGLVTAELLKANGCKVIGFDFDQKKIDIAKAKGIIAVNLANGEDSVKYVLSQTQELGADAVIITASNKTNEIISNAANMSRKRGRIVLVGVVGLNLNRAEFYEKELSFQVSCSYGPGRYDYEYEQKGNDYPLAFVRWTEKRNFETILAAMEDKSLNVSPLISEIIDFKNYQKIYGNIGKSSSIATILKYSDSPLMSRSIEVDKNQSFKANGSFGIIGAGNFTNAMILPNLKRADAPVKYIASSGGLSSKTMANKFKIAKASSDYREMLKDPEIGMVLITTRHNLHASMTIEALNAGKHVFVEKPLALRKEELTEIREALNKNGKSVVVGFNRRFSPHVQNLVNNIGSRDTPMNMIATMNAGFIPSDSWVHDLQIGGGRLVGEACHYLDLLSYICGSSISAICVNSLGKKPEESTDNASILVRFRNGSNGAINYFANGSKSYSKERLEVYSQQRTYIIDNFRSSKAYGAKGFKPLRTKQDKGHRKQFELLTKFLLEGGQPIVSNQEVLNVSFAALAIIESLKKGTWIEVE